LYTQNPSSSDSQIMTIIILEQLKIKESVCWGTCSNTDFEWAISGTLLSKILKINDYYSWCTPELTKWLRRCNWKYKNSNNAPNSFYVYEHIRCKWEPLMCLQIDGIVNELKINTVFTNRLLMFLRFEYKRNLKTLIWQCDGEVHGVLKLQMILTNGSYQNIVKTKPICLMVLRMY
jgi:hypothetical protein